MSLTFKTDSLERTLDVNQQYIASIKKVLTGDVKTVDFDRDSIIEAARKEVGEVNLEPSKQDSMLRAIVAQEDKYNPLIDNETLEVVLFPPVKGTISEDYNPETKHFAVDVVTIKDSPVKAAADGTVIIADWTADTGHVIVLIHANNLISIYKHNASLHKEQGELVKAGEVIATVGNTGELTTGPHLHFELWSDGYPINPNNFIDFD